MDKPYDIYDYDILDRNGDRVGSITGFWVDETTGQPEFASVKTGWLLGKNHIIPIRDAQFDYAGRRLRVPYAESVVKKAPTFEPDHNLSPQEEARVYEHYRLGRGVGGVQGRRQPNERGSVEMPLREEKVDIGKRQVETGKVHLRKVVKTDTVSVPVDLTKERIEIERLPAEKLKGTFSGRAWKDAFQEQDITLTERREEPVVDKHSEVTGGVRANKEIETERRDVRAQTRREDVDIDREEEGGPGLR